MQIAFCHENVLPARGGAEMYVADLARRLAAAGHEVHLYACRWDASALPADLHYHPLPAPTGPRFLRPWRFSASVREALERDRPQVSIGFDKTWGPDIYYPLGGLHQASAAHNRLKYRYRWQRVLARLLQHADLAQRSFARLERRQLAGADRPLVIANSQLVRRHVQQYYSLPAQQIRVVPNAIDPDRFPEEDRPRLRVQMRDQWGIPTHVTVAAIVAMNYRLKGLEPLLRALPLLPANAPFRLLVVGSPKFASYERLARRLGVAEMVRFVGHCSDVRRVFFASDLLVHPTFYDPCSLVVLEALACGLPVITTRYNGASEFLHPPAEGFVIDDPHNAQQLADALTALLDHDRRTACARAARQTASQWTFDHHYQALLSIFEEAAVKKKMTG